MVRGKDCFCSGVGSDVFLMFLACRAVHSGAECKAHARNCFVISILNTRIRKCELEATFQRRGQAFWNSPTRRRSGAKSAYILIPDLNVPVPAAATRAFPQEYPKKEMDLQKLDVDDADAAKHERLVEESCSAPQRMRSHSMKSLFATPAGCLCRCSVGAEMI